MSSTKPYPKVKIAGVLTQCTASSWAKIVTQTFEQQEDFDKYLHNCPSLNDISVHNSVDLQK